MKLRGRIRLASCFDHRWPADKGRHPHSAFPQVQLRAIVAPKGVEVIRSVDAHVVQSTLTQRPIVGSKHNQGAVIDFQVLEKLN